MNQHTLSLVAPISGVLVPIESVPDPVFAKKMVGEGVSIDPTSNILLSPCDGEVTLIHAGRHAITVRHETGIEVLMHIGLDTVAMNGSGFKVLTKVGAKVSIGDQLIEIDLDLVAREAKSLLTQIVITNADTLASFEPKSGLVEAGVTVIADLELKEATDQANTSLGDKTVTSAAVIIGNPTGLHARPAATLVNLAKKYDSTISIRRGENQANAKSVIAVLAMSVLKGDKVQVIAHGPDADVAAQEIAEAIRNGLGEKIDLDVVAPAEKTSSNLSTPTDSAAKQDPVIPVAASAEPKSGDINLLIGVPASPGIGIGQVVQMHRNDIAVKEFGKDKHVETRRLNTAIDRASVELQTLENRLSAEADPEQAAIFGAHRELLTDPDLLDLASSNIDKGKSAPFAWRAAYTAFADQLAGLSNEVLAARANDVRDVGVRVLEELTGQRAEKQELSANTILIAEDLTPSDTAALDRTKVVGFATTTGGASSHVAILARSFDIPAIAGIEPRALHIEEGTHVVLDGSHGTLRINVSEDEITKLRAKQLIIAERKRVELAHAHQEACTTDGHKIDVVANIGGLDDAQHAAKMGAEGVGLLRSEFLFLGRNTAPTEDEQAEIYQSIAKAIPGKPLVIRTLDVGGDKPLPYLPIAPEENPFLGQRGIRVGLDRPDILRTQVRAILRAYDAGAQIHVMFPMIATLRDFRLAKEIFEDERHKMGVAEIPLGVMVEVPSVAIMAEQFAREVSFFSVGTNDLTQYTLAMDRGHPALASQVDALNPAVLALIGRAAEAAHKYDRWIGVCGGVASDPQAIPLLIGLGVDELSASIPAIPSIKAQVRSYSIEQCQDLAASALRKDTAAAVRDLVPLDED